MDTAYEMVSNIPIPPETEIFNTYGEHLTNAQLLLRYGFILDVNENDCVTWTLTDVTVFAHRLWSLEIDTSLVQDLWSRIINHQNHDWSPFSESQLVFWDTSPLNPPLDAGSAPRFIVNAEGKTSFDLWLYITLLVYIYGESGDGRLSAEATDSTISKMQLEKVSEFVKDIAALQFTLESESGGPDSKDLASSNAHFAKTIRDIAGTFIELCEIRLNGMGKFGELEAELDLNDFLEVRVHSVLHLYVANADDPF